MHTEIYRLARQFETQYDEIGFVRLRNRPNDEVIIALAMAMNNEHPVIDDASILAEFVNFQSGIKSTDLLKGGRIFNTNPCSPRSASKTGIGNVYKSLCR